MLPPDYLATAPDSVIRLVNQVEEDILCDMARRIVQTGQLTATAQWQAWRLEQLGASQTYIRQQLQRLTGKTQGEINALFQEAGQQALYYDDQIYQAAGLNPGNPNDSPALLNLLNAGAQQTGGTFENLTATTANTASQQFERALDRAWLQLASGAFSYQAVIRQAIKDLARQGLQAIVYPSGHVDTLEVATRRAIMTGLNQTAAKLSLSRADDMDCDLVEVTAHHGARPSHQVWQGKVYSRSGRSAKYPDFVSSTGYGSGSGLCGWNCRHNFFPFFEGLSRSAYPEEVLRRYENQTVTYNGEKLSYYDATQKQRYLERQVRRWKREYLMMDAAGQDTTKAATKLNAWRRSLDDFLKQTGLDRQASREMVNGFGRSAAASAKGLSQRLQKYGREGIIKQEILKTGAIPEKAEIHLTPKKIDIQTLGFDDAHLNQERNHHVSEEEAKLWIQNSILSATVWGGKFERYYGRDGAVYVNVAGHFIRTAYSSAEYDEKTKALMEVLKKYGLLL